MKFKAALPFLKTNHRGVITTNRTDGASHSSVVVCGVYDGSSTFVSVYPKSQKIKNLRRDPRCTLLSVSEDWRNYVVVEGIATLKDYANTERDTFRCLLREVYMSCSDSPHPNWQEYDEAMVAQKAVIVSINPDKTYGLLR